MNSGLVNNTRPLFFSIDSSKPELAKVLADMSLSGRHISGGEQAHCCPGDNLS